MRCLTVHLRTDLIIKRALSLDMSVIDHRAGRKLASDRSVADSGVASYSPNARQEPDTFNIIKHVQNNLSFFASKHLSTCPIYQS
jgi:hypothetical protein